jgi:hypothetical protein
MSVMKCERSVITMTLQWHSSQVSSLDNYVDDTPTETGLSTLNCLKGLAMKPGLFGWVKRVRMQAPECK